MHPRYELAKEYHVLTTRRPSEPTLQRLRAGVVVDGRRVVPDEVRILRETREGSSSRSSSTRGCTASSAA